MANILARTQVAPRLVRIIYVMRAPFAPPWLWHFGACYVCFSLLWWTPRHSWPQLPHAVALESKRLKSCHRPLLLGWCNRESI